MNLLLQLLIERRSGSHNVRFRSWTVDLSVGCDWIWRCLPVTVTIYRRRSLILIREAFMFLLRYEIMSMIHFFLFAFTANRRHQRNGDRSIVLYYHRTDCSAQLDVLGHCIWVIICTWVTFKEKCNIIIINNYFLDTYFPIESKSLSQAYAVDLQL